MEGGLFLVLLLRRNQSLALHTYRKKVMGDRFILSNQFS